MGEISKAGVKTVNDKFVLSRIYTGDFFACDFLIKMDVAKLNLFNNGSHCDESYLTAENDSLKLFPFR